MINNDTIIKNSKDKYTYQYTYKCRYKFIFLCILSLFLFLVGCSDNAHVEVLKIYFPNENMEFDVKEIELKETAKVDMINEVKDYLENGFSKNASNLYQQIKITSLELNEETLIVRLSGDYQSLNISQRIMLRTGIVKSFSKFDFITKIRFFINEMLMTDEYGKKMEDIEISNVMLGDEDNSNSNITVCNLYFSNGEKLVVKEKALESQSTQLLAKALINGLIDGPKEEGLKKVMPKGTRLKSLEIKDGICYVDFNKSFRDNHEGGFTNETLTIYAIVNTLTDLPGIEGVQFLIDGEKSEEYKGNYEFNLPFTRNESVLYVER